MYSNSGACINVAELRRLQHHSSVGFDEISARLHRHAGRLRFHRLFQQRPSVLGFTHAMEPVNVSAPGRRLRVLTGVS